MRCIRKFPDFCKPIAPVCHMTPGCEHALFLHGAFSTSCFVLFALDGKIEQRVCIKFWLKLGKSTTENLEMLHDAFGEHSLSRTAVFEWHSRFKAGRVSIEDDERSGRQSISRTTENVEKNSRIQPRRRSPNNPWARRHRWDHLWICQEILTENLNMLRTASNFVPRLLTNDQKQRSANICLELREKANEDFYL
jgi:hypothetical protein